MYTCKIYNKTHSGNSVTQLLRLASKIANKYNLVIDTCKITDNQGISCEFTRINKVYPNGTIKRGKWI